MYRLPDKEYKGRGFGELLMDPICRYVTEKGKYSILYPPQTVKIPPVYEHYGFHKYESLSTNEKGAIPEFKGHMVRKPNTPIPEKRGPNPNPEG